MSRIVVVGAGYVGVTAAACFADLGHAVVLVDTDSSRVDELRRGTLPFFEPGLEELMNANAHSHRLSFSNSYGEDLKHAEFVFLAVQTPEGPNGEADLQYLEAAARSAVSTLTGPAVIINKSTVPIRTGDAVRRIVDEAQRPYCIDVVSNPEFLREGSAISDFVHPHRVIIGATDAEASARVAKLYEPFGAPIVETTVHNAEMIKYASNAYLATRISFINEMAGIAEQFGADIKVVAHGMGLDPRIGQSFLEAGLGYGGSCLPKDVKAIASIAQQYGYHPELLNSVMSINADQRLVVVDKVERCLMGLRDRVVGLWGLSFKPETDDLREAPSIDIARALQVGGARVRAYDPAAMRRARAVLPEVELLPDAYSVATGADAIIVVTEWNEFKTLDLRRVQGLMRTPVLVDGRNIFDPQALRDLGFIYSGIGRP